MSWRAKKKGVFCQDSHCCNFELTSASTPYYKSHFHYCAISDQADGALVEPQQFTWEVSRPGEGWSNQFKPDELATRVEGMTSKQLLLDGLIVSQTDLNMLSASYEVRCVAQFNTTYSTASRAFPINVHRKLF